MPRFQFMTIFKLLLVCHQTICSGLSRFLSFRFKLKWLRLILIYSKIYSNSCSVNLNIIVFACFARSMYRYHYYSTRWTIQNQNNDFYSIWIIIKITRLCAAWCRSYTLNSFNGFSIHIQLNNIPTTQAYVFLNGTFERSNTFVEWAGLKVPFWAHLWHSYRTK